MKYVSVAEMIAIEKESDELGHTYSKMMEHAGRGLAEVVHETFADLGKKNILGLVGSGNNGGDTLVALSYLADWGWETTAYIVRTRPVDDSLVERAREAGSEILDVESDARFGKLTTALKNNSVVMDGILGTGVRLPLHNQVSKILAFIKRKISNMEPPLHVVAVDCPSGVDCDSGEAAQQCIPAQMTVTMAAIKSGLLRFPAYNFVGDLKLV